MLDKHHIKKEHLLDSKSQASSLLAYLSTHYPETLSEGRLNLEALSRLLGLEISERGYELNFTGKPLATALYGRKSTKELKLESHFNPTSHDTDSSKQAGEASQSDSKDKGARRQNLDSRDSRAEAVEMRNRGFQGGGEGVTKAVMTEKGNAESTIYRSNATPQDSTPYPHTIIKGDNLDALKLLKSAYTEKIKMIYIDPPYNTHSENFIYNDSKREDFTQILREVGLLYTNEDGEEVESESLRFFRNITGSRSHSGWLAFMLPRLKLARDLLRDDGVIFISIDDNEQANLKLLCDEIFGEENFCGQIIWLKGNAQNDADTIQRNQEYILCYAKNIESKPINALPYKEKVKAFRDEKTGRFYYEGAGLTTGGAGGTLNARPNLGFSIYYNPQTKDFFAKNDYDKELAKISNDEQEVYTSDSYFLEGGYEIIRPPKKGVGLGRWTWALDKFNSNKDSILIHKNAKGYNVLKKEWLDSKQVKKDDKGDYYAMVDKESPPKSFIDFAGSGRGTTELKQVFNAKVFNNPKNTILLKHLLKIATTSPLQCGGGGGVTRRIA